MNIEYISTAFKYYKLIYNIYAERKIINIPSLVIHQLRN